MRYTPKHAAPRTSTRRLAGLGVAGTASLVAGLTLSGPAAQAQEGDVWDRVAACESGGDWDINTGNPFSGGLQFLPSTWNGFGGQEYAPYAYQATKAQQIEIAQRVLAVQGPGAWPVCSVEAGLTTANGGASGGSPAPAPAPAPAPEPAPAPAPAPAPEPAPAPAPAPAPESAPAPAAEPTPESRDQGASRGSSRAAGPSYTVQAGDTVGKIAQAQGSSVSAIVSANGLADGGRLIYVGDTLTVPGGSAPAAATEDYTVQAGDTVFRIAADNDTTIQAVVDANDLADPDFIVVGEQLAIPGH